MQVQLPFINESVCNGPSMYNGNILPGMFCAGFKAGGQDSCRVRLKIYVNYLGQQLLEK